MKNKFEDSFEKVLDDNRGSIYRICRIYAVAPAEPHDLFQEVVYQIWKSFSDFKGNASINTWVYRIALNVCLRSKLKLERNNTKTVRLESIQFTPVSEVQSEEEQLKYQFLKECMTTLNESDRSILVLFLEELPYKEIAEVTGLTENHIAVKMRRIRKRLFDCIAPKLQ